MPTTAELERIEALVARMLPLSTKRRGELIEAEEWNLLVGALGQACVGSSSARTPARALGSSDLRKLKISID